MDLHVFGPDGLVLASSAALTNPETVALNYLAGGDYFLVVMAYDSAPVTAIDDELSVDVDY